MKPPDFLCIGAQKAGTTWLYNNLIGHPQVALPHFKELHYFDEIEAGIRRDIFSRLFDKHWKNGWWRDTFKYSMYWALKEKDMVKVAWLLKYFFAPRGMNWYASLFPSKAGTITGEFTPEYCLLNLKLIEEIRDRFPKMKVIFLLRNPVERDWSNIKMWHKRVNGVKDIKEVDREFLLRQAARQNELSSYAQTIDRWSRYVPNDQFFIGFYDDIVERPEELMQRISAFLGIDHVSTGLESKVFNKGLTGGPDPEISRILTSKYAAELQQLMSYFDGREREHIAKWMEPS